MSKLITFAILVVCVTLVSASCNQNPLTTNSNGNQNSSSPSQVAAAQEMEVTILFSGLMVLNKKSDGNFEMGILADKDVQKHHVFCVRQAAASKVICRADIKPAMGTAWSLTVTNPTPITQDFLGGESPRAQRRPDGENYQYDFNWIIHFDEQFHTHPLQLEPGHLNPIIQLPKGQFFTRHKSHDFVRTKGGTAESGAFGFVAETTGLRLTLKPGQELLLLDQAEKKILSVPYATPAGGSNGDIISITNVRHEPSGDSDFKYYYNLFSNLKEEKSQHYDFYRNKDHPCPGKPGKDPCYPLNMVPHDEEWERKAEVMTCCAMDCTKIYLSKSGSALR